VTEQPAPFFLIVADYDQGSKVSTQRSQSRFGSDDAGIARASQLQHAVEDTDPTNAATRSHCPALATRACGRPVHQAVRQSDQTKLIYFVPKKCDCRNEHIADENVTSRQSLDRGGVGA
jgi:hypothetical protein